MSQPFTFPPPPPPPPKPVQNSASASFQTRGGQRGRGNFSLRGRGRGQHPSHGQPRGGYSGGNQSNSTNNEFIGHQQYSQARSRNPNGSHGQVHSGQKRDHAVAFQTRNDDNLRKSRPLAPPAVPSYGIDFDALLSKKPDSSVSKPIQNKSTANALGLTPRANADDSEGSDVDEEAELARSAGVNGTLQFEYQGQKSTLHSSEDIAAWIAERRKKWPTQAKRDSAEKEATEKRRKWQEEKDARAKASQAAAKVRQDEYLKQKAEREKSRIRQQLLQAQVKKAKEKAASKAPQNDAEAKAEKLRRKAEKIAKQLEAAEHALLQKKQQADGDDDVDTLISQVDEAAASQQGGVIDDEGFSAASSSSDEAVDDTSTSGSSDSDTNMESDSEPEQASSKRTGAERILAPPRKTAPGTTSDTRQPCQKFVKTGQCKFGRKCRYRHDKADRKATAQAELGSGKRRKGLYQILVDKEAEEEQRNALKAIIALGNAGLLDEPSEPRENVDGSAL